MNEINNQIIKINPDVVFYHIEKCGGSSIENMLYKYFLNIYSDKEIYIPKKNNNKHYKEEQKTFFEENQFKVILSHISFNHPLSIFPEHLSITCIRNPIDRIISHYYFFDFDHYKIPLNSLNEEQIITYINKRLAILFRISGETQNIDIAFNNLKKIKIILILEKINDDILKLNKVLNNYFDKTNLEIKINKINITTNKYYSENLQKDINSIKQLNFSKLNDEIQLYNYVCEMDDVDRFNLTHS